MAEAPASLCRLGLVSVADNVPPGMRVCGFERDFALLFREEIFSRLDARRKACAEAGPQKEALGSKPASLASL